MAASWNDITKGIQEARSVLSLSDEHIASMAKIIVGRLRAQNVPGGILKELKAELKDFNSTTYKWRKQ